MNGRKRLIGDILVELGHISSDQLREAVEEQGRSGEAAPLIGDILKQKGIVTDKELDEAFLISLGDILESPDTDRFVKQLARLSASFVKTGGSGLSKEALLAILNRIDYLKNRIERLQESQITLRRMRQNPLIEQQLAENEKQVAETAHKIQVLYEDLKAHGMPDVNGGLTGTH